MSEQAESGTLVDLVIAAYVEALLDLLETTEAAA